MNKNTESNQLCACGCGGIVNPKRKFVHGHNTRGKPSPLKTLPTTPAPLCACGCGELVLWSNSRRRWNMYVKGHEHIGRTHSEAALVKMRDAAAKRADDVAEANRQRVWTEESRRKLSESKKRIVLPHRFKNGDANPCFKHGKKYKRISYPKLAKIRQNIINSRGFKCEICSSIPQQKRSLHLHHIDENPKNNDTSNLRLVCASCHTRITHNMPN